MKKLGNGIKSRNSDDKRPYSCRLGMKMSEKFLYYTVGANVSYFTFIAPPILLSLPRVYRCYIQLFFYVFSNTKFAIERKYSNETFEHFLLSIFSSRLKWNLTKWLDNNRNLESVGFRIALVSSCYASFYHLNWTVYSWQNIWWSFAYNQ